jgi:hypothetical protein
VIRHDRRRPVGCPAWPASVPPVPATSPSRPPSRKVWTPYGCQRAGHLPAGGGIGNNARLARLRRPPAFRVATAPATDVLVCRPQTSEPFRPVPHAGSHSSLTRCTVPEGAWPRAPRCAAAHTRYAGGAGLEVRLCRTRRRNTVSPWAVTSAAVNSAGSPGGSRSIPSTVTSRKVQFQSPHRDSPTLTAINPRRARNNRTTLTTGWGTSRTVASPRSPGR